MLFVGGVVYVMSKLVLVGLVKGMVCDLGLCGIMVNNVVFGLVDIDMNLEVGEFGVVLYDLMVLCCYVKVDEIVGMVVYLVSLEVGFVIGVDLLIDGGFVV